uniref:Secreted protein n=1 Tax=Steinernema glaseri TaxID=37863 RepID=A0A1I7Z4B9_9BILA
MNGWYAFIIIPAIVLIIFAFFLAARAASNRTQSRATTPIFMARPRNEAFVSAGTGVVNNSAPVYMVNSVEDGQQPSTQPQPPTTSVQLHAVNEAQPNEAPPSYDDVIKTDSESDANGHSDAEKAQTSNTRPVTKEDHPKEEL